MGLKFNPPKNVARYAVFAKDSRGQGTFSVYNDLGSAKNATYHRYNSDGIYILENVDGDWYVLFDIPAGTKGQDLPWYKEVSKYDWYLRSEKTYKKAVPMTREEYAEWRVTVEHERLAQSN